MSTNYNDFSKHGVTTGNARAAKTQTWLTVAEAAEMLGKRQNTIINWCRSGELAAVPAPFGTKISWNIPIASIIAKQELLKAKESNKINKLIPKKLQSHKDLIKTYIRFCEQGLISGRPHSPATIKNNKYFLETFLNKYEYASFETLRAELLEIPIEMFTKREKTWIVVLGFTKWLAEEGYGEPETVEKVMKLKPKRPIPPKRLALTEEQLDAMENACKNSYERAIVILLSQTGVRSSEFCSWTMQKINLQDREIKFRGKVNKERWVGLTNKAYEALSEYLKPKAVLSDGAFSTDDTLKRLTDYGWTFVMRGRNNRSVSGCAICSLIPRGFGETAGFLKNGVKLKIIRNRKHFLFCNRMLLERQAIQALYRLRWKIEEVFRVLKSGLRACIHTHPMSEPQNGFYQSPVMFHTQIDRPGLYKMWIQTQIEGKLRTVDWTFQV